MYRPSNKISNVQSCKAHENKIYYSISDELFCNSVSVIDNLEPQSFSFYDEFIFYYLNYKDDKSLCIKSNDLLLTIKGSFHPNSYFNKTICISTNEEFVKEKLWFKNNCSLLKIGPSLETIDLLTIENAFVLYQDEKNIAIITDRLNITAISKDGKKIRWQHELSYLSLQPDGQLDKVYKFLGVKNNMAFILTVAGCIVVLNSDSGNLIKLIYEQDFPNMNQAFMHPDQNYIFCLAYRFVKINTQTLAIESIKPIGSSIKDPMDNVSLYNIKSSSYQGDHISFTSFTKYRSGFAKWVGLFDYTTESIICHQEILPAEGQLSFPAGISPQLAGSKLYILDKDNVLHIMERNEEGESDTMT